jgi:serine protease Do
MNVPKLLPSLVLVLVLGLLPTQVLSADKKSANLDVARQLNEAFVQVAESVSPSVVVITVTEKPTARPEFSEEGETDSRSREFWRRFHRELQEQPQEGQGSGIIVRKNGFILTNRHVVEAAEKIQVRLLDGRIFTATVRGVDAQSDVAVIKIEAEDLPVARLGDSSKARVGEFAIAIGAPFSLDYSVTYGHLSAKSRGNVVPFEMGGQAMDQDFLQTDANINPGNSGGPLVNIEGEVIGVNTLIRGLRSGIGFAIPINLAKEISEKLITDGKFARPWLGISISALQEDAELRKSLKGIDTGVVVRAVLPNGPAAQSDLRRSDIITAVEGKRVSTPQQLRGEVRGKAIGQTVKLEVFRAGKNIQVNIKPAEYVPPATSIADNRFKPIEATPSALGLSVRALTAELARHLGVKATNGVVVMSVERNGLADRKAIKPGDLIIAVNQQSITSPTQLEEVLQKADLKKGVSVNLLKGETEWLEVLKDGNE